MVIFVSFSNFKFVPIDVDMCDVVHDVDDHIIYVLGHHFFIFCFPNSFCNKLGSEVKIKIKYIQTIFQLNLNRRKHKIVFPSILIQMENCQNEFHFYFTK